MDDKHPYSQEPWVFDKSEIGIHYATPYFSLVDGTGRCVDVHCVDDRLNPGKCEANARRIVACVNACEGISTEALEDWAPRIHQREEIRETILGALQVALVHASDFADAFAMSVTHMTDEEMMKPLGEHTRSPNAILRGRRESVRKIEDAIKVVSEWPMR